MLKRLFASILIFAVVMGLLVTYKESPGTGTGNTEVASEPVVSADSGTGSVVSADPDTGKVTATGIGKGIDGDVVVEVTADAAVIYDVVVTEHLSLTLEHSIYPSNPYGYWYFFVNTFYFLHDVY